MKRFAKLLVVTLGFGALGFMMSLVPQKNATGAGAAPVNIVSSIPLTVTGTVAAQQSGTWNVGINGTPTVSLASGATVNVGNVSSPVPVQSVKQSAANFKTLLFNGTGTAYQEVLADGTLSPSAFAIPAGEQFVITDIDWVAFCSFASSCSVSAGDPVLFSLGEAFSSLGTYAVLLGLEGVAGRNEHLTSGIVTTSLPTPNVPAGNASGTHVVLRGYLVP